MTGLGRLLGVAGLVVLTGCAGQPLSFTKPPPNEFEVLTQAPLELPPDLSNLPPPRPGAPRPQETTPARIAAEIVGGAYRSAGLSAGELALLEQAGANDAPADIRAVIESEATEIMLAQTSPMERMFGRPDDLGDIVDPVREAERIRANLEAGRPITFGETPIVPRRPRAPLEGWGRK